MFSGLCSLWGYCPKFVKKCSYWIQCLFKGGSGHMKIKFHGHETWEISLLWWMMIVLYVGEVSERIWCRHPTLMVIRLVTWKGKYGSIWVLCRKPYSPCGNWTGKDKQRSLFDRETRMATQWWNIWKQFYVHRSSLVLPCGFFDQIQASACLISFINRTRFFWARDFLASLVNKLHVKFSLTKLLSCANWEQQLHQYAF